MTRAKVGLSSDAGPPCKLRIIAGIQILIQGCMPLVLSLAPMQTANAVQPPMEINQYSFKRGHTFKKGETLEQLARDYNISLQSLRELNRIHLPQDNEFYNLQYGNYLFVPQYHSPMDWEYLERANKPQTTVQEPSLSHSSQQQTDDSQQKAARFFSQAGQIAAGDDRANALKQIAIGSAAQAVGQEVEKWLTQFGNVRVNLAVDNKFTFSSANADLLLPLYEHNNLLTYSQLGLNHNDDYSTLNLGVGQRWFNSGYMLGYNLFIDQELRNNHTRLGIGMEYWRDYLKLAGNGYIGLSSWKTSKALDDYQERAASGFDLRAEGYLPAWPQLGAKLSYEQYFGDNVGLFGKDKRQQDPYAISTGINYTPIPLVTTGVDYKQGKGSANDTLFNLQLNYQFGVPWQQQLSADAIASRRSLAGSKLDFVDRRGDMVMQYRKMEVIKLALPPRIEGQSGSIQTMIATVNTKYGLDRISWNGNQFLSNGGHIRAISATQYAITLPTQAGRYPLQAIAYDRHGNASQQASSEIIVQAATGSNWHIANLAPSTQSAIADGQSPIAYSLQVVDDHGQPASDYQVQWKNEGAGDLATTHTKTDANGNTSNTLTSKIAGAVKLTVTLLDADGKPLTQGTDNQSKFESTNNYQLVLTPPTNSAQADGNEKLEWTLTATDDNGAALKNAQIQWKNSGTGDLAAPTTSTDENGNSTNSMTSTIAGPVDLTVTLLDANGQPLVQTTDQKSQFVNNYQLALTPPTNNAIADGNEKLEWTLTATDGNGAALKNTQIQWKNSGTGDLAAPTTSTDDNGTSTNSMTSTIAGPVDLTVTLLDANGQPLAQTTDQKSQFVNNYQLALTPPTNNAIADGNEKLEWTLTATDGNGAALKNAQIQWQNNGTGDLAALTTNTDDNGNSTNSMTNTIAGSVDLTVILLDASGQPLAQTTDQTSQFVNNYQMTLTPSSIHPLANGTELLTWEVRATDNFGDPLKNMEIQWDNTGVGDVKSSTTQTNDQGVSSNTMTSSLPGQVKLTVKLLENGKEQIVQQDTTVNFMAAPTITLSSQTAEQWSDRAIDLSAEVKQSDASQDPIVNQHLIWTVDCKNVQSCTADPSPPSDKDGKTTSKLQVTKSVSSTGATVTAKACLENDKQVCSAEKTFTFYTPPTIDSYQPLAGNSTNGNSFNQTRIKHGLFDLSTSGGDGNGHWESQTPAAATVDNKGQVKLLADRATEITFTAFKGQPLERSATFNITTGGAWYEFPDTPVRFTQAAQNCPSSAPSLIASQADGDAVFKVWGDFQSYPGLFHRQSLGLASWVANTLNGAGNAADVYKLVGNKAGQITHNNLATQTMLTLCKK
ncbi:inverse autotransporter beta domain-containing protein [Serratia quinivorans]|uniref:inverse autotransporter beta domain-containing protein n=1 Tax=Serratia quinivorans TaxID=137545 RepID=UPI00217B1C08|nr:inverse autotransporter beta domain-containing protein [Serratia quinivorans]CAI1011698.1 Gamma-intimin [Serratia quinivorans]CAI1811898.1 Gamma-intimin [Serratia quinivorans]